MMFVRPLLFIVFGFFAAACQQRPPVSAEQIVACHVAAIGGESALGKIGGWHVAAVVHDLPSPGKIQTWVKSPGKVRIDSSIGGVEEAIGTNGRVGWSRDPRGIEKLTGKRMESIRNKGYLNEILASRAGHGKITLDGEETVDGRKCHVLVLGPSKRDSVTAYLDSASFLLVKTVTPMKSPKGTLMRLEVRYSDYRKVGGIMIPFMREARGDYGSYRIATQTAEVDVSPDDSLFEVPAK